MLKEILLFTILSFADFANYKYGILAAIDIIHNYNGCQNYCNHFSSVNLLIIWIFKDI